MMIRDTWLGSIQTFLHLFLRRDNGIIVNHPYAHVTLKVCVNVQVYNAFTLSVQGTCANCTRCTRYLFTRISKVYEEVACLFPFSNNKGHFSHTLLDHTLIPFIFMSSYMFIILLTIVMMKRNVIWHQFFQILLTYGIGTSFAHLYGFMCCRCMEFLSLYKAFTLSVQDK